VSDHVRKDDGHEFIAKADRAWLATLDVGPLRIEPGQRFDNGRVKRFNGMLRDENLTGEVSFTLTEARVSIEMAEGEKSHHAAQVSGLQSTRARGNPGAGSHGAGLTLRAIPRLGAGQR
jgi:transposase InsO family protein